MGGQRWKTCVYLIYNYKCKFDLDQSEGKSTQVYASQQKCAQVLAKRRRKFSTCVHLRCHLHSSYHSLHTNWATPFRVALRLRHMCSSDETFTFRIYKLIHKCPNYRGYNLKPSFRRHEIRRVHAMTRNETLKPSQTTSNQPSCVPLVITYNPVLRSISSITQKHFSILSFFTTLHQRI